MQILIRSVKAAFGTALRLGGLDVLLRIRIG